MEPTYEVRKIVANDTPCQRPCKCSTQESSPCSCSGSGSCGSEASSSTPDIGIAVPAAEPSPRILADAGGGFAGGTAGTGGSGPLIPGGPDLDAKLAIFDREAANAAWFLMKWITRHQEDLVALARGRHVEGHYRYGDRNFLEWDDAELTAQAAQEIADAIVYISRLLHRAREEG